MIPGLESIRDASGPALSSDLKTLVYAADRRGSGETDLFLADREGPEKPFGAPGLIRGCDTESNDHSPNLAGDALELAFLRGDRPHAMTRPSRRSNFGSPEPLDLRGPGGVDLGPLETIQLSEDGLTLTFRVGGSGSGHYEIASRRARGGPFGQARPLTVWYPWAFNAFSAGVSRDYAVSGDGLAVAGRRGPEDPFGMPGLIQLTMPAKVGPITGPVWLAPREDLVVYSSTGPPTVRAKGGQRKEKATADVHRSFWMVRIR